MKKFENLMRSEIKKAEAFATKLNGKSTRMTGWFFDGSVDELGFADIRCEMCSNNMNDREDDVIVHVFMHDRRRSFVSAR